MGLLFSILIGIAEKFCANELTAYLEKYHAQRKADEIASAPLDKSELIGSFK